jgi:uncharacterized membrane protein YeaQ/YmgE (transglycosylase-associated protein family)
MRGAGYGPIVDIVIGIIGAVIGGWIMRSLGFAGQGGTIYTILVAIGGAVVLTAIIRLIAGPRGGASVSNIDRGSKGGFGRAA